MSENEPEPRALDAYEAKYMGGAEALAHSKMRMPWWFFALMGAVGAVTLGSAIAAWTIVPLFSLALLSVVTLLFSHLRMTVTTRHVHVQLGLFGPKIAVETIEQVSAEDYKAMQYGGWGIKHGVDGSWAFSVPGGRGRCVRITYATGPKSRRTIVVSSDEAEAMVSAIERARAMQRPDATGVRAEPDRADQSEESTAKHDQIEEERKKAAGR